MAIKISYCLCYLAALYVGFRIIKAKTIFEREAYLDLVIRILMLGTVLLLAERVL